MQEFRAHVEGEKICPKIWTLSRPCFNSVFRNPESHCFSKPETTRLSIAPRLLQRIETEIPFGRVGRGCQTSPATSPCAVTSFPGKATFSPPLGTEASSSPHPLIPPFPSQVSPALNQPCYRIDDPHRSRRAYKEFRLRGSQSCS